MPAVPGTTKILTFEIRDPGTDELVDPSGGVSIEWAHLGAAEMTAVDPGDIEHEADSGVYVVGILCETDGGYGARLTAVGDYTGVFEHYWQVEESLLP